LWLSSPVQVAAQQGKYLASVMNKHSAHFPSSTSSDAMGQAGAKDELPPFRYTHLGSMASVGEWKGVVDTPNICKFSAYLNGTVSFDEPVSSSPGKGLIVALRVWV
jgi:NADH dehydrogenase FAD-containing subunit